MTNDGTRTDTTTSQSGLGRDDNEGVLYSVFPKAQVV